MPEVESPLIDSSKHRETVITDSQAPKNLTDATNILGDDSDNHYPIYRERGIVRTIATGT